ncbi:MAG: electron transfer flavoprotein beta subunit [Planctomycetota bacterium]|jgi:electron transfer flavoprotein beta subunit
MNILACIKRVPSTEAQAKLTADGTGLDPAGYQYMTSFYDEIAVEEAVKTKEAHGGEVTVLTIGPSEASKELRECLAKGGDKAVLLNDGSWLSRDCRATAKALAAKIQELGSELVFMGKVATDRDNAAVGPMVATYLGWPCITEAVEVEIGDGQGTAKCETDSGMESYSFSLPAVITCNKGLNEPRYAGLKGIMAAKKKSLEESDCPAEASQVQVQQVELPAERQAVKMLGEGVDAIPALIEALRTDAQVL